MFQAWCDEQVVAGFSAATVRRRRGTLASFERWCCDRGLTLTSVRHGDVLAWLAGFECPQTRKSYLGDLRGFYGHAVRHGLVDVDPTALVPRPKVPKRSATPIDADDVRRLIEHSPRRVRLATMLAAMAGLRVAEIAALRGEDVYPTHLAVRGGKGGKDASVPLSPELRAELDRWPASGQLIGGLPTSVSGLLRRHMRRLGIEGRPHDLRHSFATEAARVSNGNLVVVAMLCRHESIETTRRYVRWFGAGHDVVASMFQAGTGAVPAVSPSASSSERQVCGPTSPSTVSLRSA